MTNEQTAVLDADERAINENAVPAKQFFGQTHCVNPQTIEDSPELFEVIRDRMRYEFGKQIVEFLESDTRAFIPHLHFVKTHVEEIQDKEFYFAAHEVWQWTCIMFLADWRVCKVGEACAVADFFWNPITDTVVVIGPDMQRWNFRRAGRDGVRFYVRTS